MVTKTALRALTEAYLVKRAEVKDARAEAVTARGRPDFLRGENLRWEEEHLALVKDQRASGQPIRTAQQQHLRGNGSGAHTSYRTCRHADKTEQCSHDPMTPPYSDADIAAAEATAGAADKRLAKLERELQAMTEDGTDSFDVANAAKEAGARFAWWPATRYTDPRRTSVWQGRPVTDDELAALGPHALQRELARGGIIEVAP